MTIEPELQAAIERCKHLEQEARSTALARYCPPIDADAIATVLRALEPKPAVDMEEIDRRIDLLLNELSQWCENQGFDFIYEESDHVTSARTALLTAIRAAIKTGEPFNG